MSIRVTITASGVTNEYGQALAIGTVYTPNNDDYALALIAQLKATDTDDVLGERINAPFDEVVYPLDPVGLSADGTSLVSGDGSFLYGPVTSGTWMKVPSIFRLRITGTGTLQMDSKDSQGNITLATFPLTSYTSETDKIEFPYAGDDAVTIRVTLTGTLTCEVI